MRVRRRTALAVALCAALLAGCGAVRAFLTTERALERAGYRVSNIGFEPDDIVSVTWRPRAFTTETLHLEALTGAGIVWDVAPFRIGGVLMIATGTSLPGARTSEFGRADLEAEFGPRPPGRDDKTLEDLVDPQGILVAVGVAALVGIGVAVLIVVLVVRGGRRRRREQTWPPPGQWQPGQPPGQWPPGQWPAPPPGWPPPPGAWPPPTGPTPDDPFRSPGGGR